MDRQKKKPKKQRNTLPFFCSFCINQRTSYLKHSLLSSVEFFFCGGGGGECECPVTRERRRARKAQKTLRLFCGLSVEKLINVTFHFLFILCMTTDLVLYLELAGCSIRKRWNAPSFAYKDYQFGNGNLASNDDPIK